MHNSPRLRLFHNVAKHAVYYLSLSVLRHLIGDAFAHASARANTEEREHMSVCAIER